MSRKKDLAEKWSYRKACCKECPWKLSAKIGKFPPERYKRLAGTAYDLASTVFACHMSSEDSPLICAGFLLRGAAHNLRVRVWKSQGKIGKVRDRRGLYESYREMAVANGVSPDDPSLRECRDE
jgi:hypothetical protein